MRVTEERSAKAAAAMRVTEERSAKAAAAMRVTEERSAAAAIAARTAAEARRAEAEQAAAQLEASIAAESKAAAAARVKARAADEARATATAAERKNASAAVIAAAQAEAHRLAVAQDAADRALDARTQEVADRRREAERLADAKTSTSAELERQQVAATAARVAREREEARLVEAKAARVAEERALAALRTVKPTPATPAVAAAAPATPAKLPSATVTAVRFAPDGDDHTVTLELDGTGATAELVRADRRRAELVIHHASLPAKLTKTLDTTRFGGPVRTVSSYPDPATGDVRVVVELTGAATPRLDTSAGKVQLHFTSATPRVTTQRLPNQVVGGFGATTTPVTQTSVAQLGPKRKVYRGPTIDLNFKDADIHDLLRALATAGRVSIIVPDEVRATVTVQLKRVPWDQALDVVLASKGMAYRKEGNIYRVGIKTTLDAEDEAEAARRKALIELEAPKPDVFRLNYADAATLQTMLQPLLSPKGHVEVDVRTNSIIVNDVAASRRDIIDLAARLDTQTPQISIEARIVEARSGFRREFGIQWGGRAGVGASSGNATGLIFPSSIGLNGGADDPTNKPATGLTTPSDFAVNLPATGSNGALGLTLGSVGGNVNINLRLSALEDSGTARIISAPKVTVLNNVEALMKQGIKIPISQVSANGTQTVFVEANLELRVTANVSQRDCSVVMDVNVAKAEPDFSRLGARGDPTIQNREAHSRILVADGETSVMGGIYTRSTSLNYRKVPLLADIPVLGWLFKNRIEVDDRAELLIFITPKITNKAVLPCTQ